MSGYGMSAFASTDAVNDLSPFIFQQRGRKVFLPERVVFPMASA
jgi:CRISPR/Cas system endoribonuclease Cas6 (RAMP superfamily)